MSSKLDETFNVASNTEISIEELENVRKSLADQNTKMEKNSDETDKICDEITPYAEMALSEIQDREKIVNDLIDLHQFDGDTDMIFDESFQAFRDAFVVAKDVPAGSAGKIFEAAANFAKIALDAKNSKLKMRLDAIDLALKKRRMDQIDGKKDGETPIDGEGKFLDRNELLKSIREDLAKHDTKK